MPNNSYELKVSPEQREAICFHEGAMLVLAGPGSGKTLVITQRIRYLIEEKGVYPGHILVITFTKSAALEMQQRCLKICPTANGVVFGTFHSVFYQILRCSDKYRNYSLITYYEKQNIMKQILTVNGFAGELDAKGLLLLCNEMLTKISRQKNTGEKTEDNRLTFIMKTYQKECALRQLLDFDDMLMLCHQLLMENRVERIHWQEHFKYILVDEVQDVNGMQYELTKLLSARHKNLFVVGDDDQAIYSFRGSDPHYMQQFLQDFPESRLIRLSDNYRCGSEIVRMAANCISYNTGRFDKEIKAAAEKENKVEIKSFESKEMEMNKLCETLAESKGCKAVLLRTNTAAEYVAQCLSKKNIPYRMKEKIKCFYDNAYVEDILSVLRFVFHKPLRKDFYCFMNKPERGISRECIKTEVVDFTALKRMFDEESELGNSLRRLEKDCEFLRKLDAYAAITYILHGMKYREFLHMSLCGQEKEKAMKIMDELLRRSREYAGAPEFLAFVENYKRDLEKNYRVASKEFSTRAEETYIMTYHASKGLEFDSVFLPGVNNGIVPNGHILTREQLEEERRMFYVAMTRARKYLFVSYVKGEKDGDEVISPFVPELSEKAPRKSVGVDCKR